MSYAAKIALLLVPVLLSGSVSLGQTPPASAPPATLRSTLLEQLRSTHNKADWFVPLNTAIAGLTPEQARWVPTNAAGKLDPDANHSVGMLAHHLLFWNSRALAQLRGQNPGAPPSNNEETFNSFDAASWNKIVHDLDTVMTDLEQFVEHADDATLAKRAQLFANISAHNAYHTGQILYVRKLQGSWNADKGVK